MFSPVIEPDGLHPKHRLLDYHQWFINQIKPEWSILDVGCGNGALTADLANHCRYVLGIDISMDNIEQAKKRSKGNFICGDATTYPFAETFDAVILSNVLEHIDDRATFLKKLKQLSKRFLIRVPLVDRDWITLYKREMGIEYRLDPTHFIEYTLDGFINELRGVGLQLSAFRIRYGELYGIVTTI
jgi:SAM-dependent methyltransferase